MSPEPEARPGAARRPALTVIDGALLLVVAIWGIGYSFFKLGQREIPTGLFNFARYGIVTPIFWFFLWRRKENWRPERRDLPKVLAIGLVGVLIYSMVFASATKFTHAANVALLLTLSPIWAVVMGWMSGRVHLSAGFLVGTAIALAGAGLVIASGAGGLRLSLDSLRGDLLALASSVIWAWYGLVAQPLLKQYSSLKLQAWLSLVALLGFMVYQGREALQFSWASVSAVGWGSVLYVAFLNTAVAHVIWYAAISRVGADRVLLAMYLVPAFAAASGRIFLGEPFGLLQVAGGLIALAGVALVRRTAK